MAVTMVTYLHTQTMTIWDRKVKLYMAIAGGFLLVFTLIYMGFRSLYGGFTDMKSYAQRFNYYAYGGEIEANRDILFQIFTRFAANWLTIEIYFILCACLYVIPLYS